jgi:ribosomal protein L37AE/L43A
MEKRQEVRTVQVDYECPSCKSGFLKPNGQGFLTNPMQYGHECKVCGFTQTLSRTYPYIDYIIKESKINEE